MGAIGERSSAREVVRSAVRTSSDYSSEDP